VRMSADTLQAECLPRDARCTWSCVTSEGDLVGSAFACRWRNGSETVCWITQLVVDESYREHGVATSLLAALREPTDDVYGILSSNPAAILAAARAFADGAVDLGYVAKHAARIMKSSPVPYVRNARLHGRLFDDRDGVGLPEKDVCVSSADTEFYVDHEEALGNLERARGAAGTDSSSGDGNEPQLHRRTDRRWLLGNLLEGHEFLLLLDSKRTRSMETSHA
jgi:ribosomal protein S18 acetylase RimI-like enzyme